MRRLDNPPNPFVGEHVEWLGPAPEVRVEVFEERPRSVLSRNDSPDVPFTWSVNPYRGCLHACAYCYARRDHEFLGWGAGTDFETRLVVKVGAPELLRKALSQRTWRGELIAFSGDTDCYQPLEAHYRLTRQCLLVCRDFRNPVGIITKSALIRRDVDLLRDLCAETPSTVTISIPFFDPDLARAIEPGTPPPRLRIDAVRTLADAGIPVSVLVAPIIPGLSESEIPTILEAVADAGARSVGRILLRLQGSVKSVFIKRLRRALPDRAVRIIARLEEIRGDSLTDGRFHRRMTGTGVYWKMIEDLFDLHARRLGLAARVGPDVETTYRRPDEQLELF